VTAQPAALELTGIRKRFASVVALDDATLTVRDATIHALLGENGAGKTTLMRVAFGLTSPDGGSVRVRGTAVRPGSAARAIRAGLGMVQQHFALAPALSIRENIALGVSAGHALGAEVVALAASLGVADLERPVGTLSVSEQQRVEIVRALARGARLLILDEPTAALAPRDAEDLFDWLRAFRERGGSVVLVTHKLRDALALADDISVLRHGRIVWHGPRGEASIDLLTTAMLGQSRAPVSDLDPGSMHAAAKYVVADAASVSIFDSRSILRVKDADIHVHSGEILGVAAVEGSGYRELLCALAGRVSVQTGSLGLPDETGFVPDDRLRDGLIPELSIIDNVALKGAGRRRGWFDTARVRSTAQRLVREYGIHATAVRALVSSLSGGNQQRLLVARELDGNPKLLVAMNPTRGLDIAAAADVHRRLLGARNAGMGIVYYTADLDELLAIADRILVVFDGHVREVPRDRASIGRAMLGAA
jgi:ABC-type uncharacterized transport system ATPase subunit